MQYRFKYELDRIAIPEIREFTEFILGNVPPRFWHEAASSTGKYHPPTSLGTGGLVTHTRQVFWIAETVLESGMFSVDDGTADVVRAACLLHDAWKYEGDRKHTLRYHATRAMERITELINDGCYFGDDAKPQWYYDIIACIVAHNGRFTNEWKGSGFTIAQKIVHIADFIASRKWCRFSVTALEEQISFRR